MSRRALRKPLFPLALVALLAFTALLLVRPHTPAPAAPADEGAAGGARADDAAYYSVRLDQLELTDGKLPPRRELERMYWGSYYAHDPLQPRVALDGDSASEAYLGMAPDEQGRARQDLAAATVLVRAPRGQDVTGHFYLPVREPVGRRPLDDADGARPEQEAGEGEPPKPRPQILKFRIPAAAGAADPAAEQAFYRAKRDHYNGLLNAGIPGAAWFRRQAREAHLAMGPDAGADPGADRWRGNQINDLSDTYDLFSGGRAMSENLQLDRVLPEAPGQGRAVPDKGAVDVDTITGITIEEMQWDELLGDADPQLDPLAAVVPADQHALFFPTYETLMRVADEADRQGAAALRFFEPRAEDAMTKQRYLRQLCLAGLKPALDLGPEVLAGVAVTGSDPYLRVGSDVAVLMEARDARQADALLDLMRTQTEAARAKNAQAGAEAVEGEAGGVAYFGAVTPDRSVSAYAARLGDGNTVVVSNSLKQLTRIAEAHGGKSPSLASLPEYKFFRNRYPRFGGGGGAKGGGQEAAFVILSDATIRRWAGPRWRIGDSRRTRAGAVMSDLQAAWFRGLVEGTIQPGPLHPEWAVPGIGDLTLTPEGVVSSTFGRLRFMTPIAEMDLDKVTKLEADAYDRWRQGYEENWTQAFDPIAVQLTLGDEQIVADVSVMPLIGGSDYNDLVEVTRGVGLTADDGDPHPEALAHYAMALNADSQPVKEVSEFAAAILPGLEVDLMGWLGDSVALYADEDPYWDEMAKAMDAEDDDWMSQNLGRLPVALYAEVKNGLKLTAFLVAVRGYIEQTAPDTTVWENRKHNGVTYVRVGPSEQVKKDWAEVGGPPDFGVYYVASGQGFVLTLNENVLKRAIDRQVARRAAKEDGGGGADAVEKIALEEGAADKPAAAGDAADAEVKPWIGKHVALQVDRKVWDIILAGSRRMQRQEMQRLAWSNLPILNEWHRLYPDEDPAELHELLWHVRLLDPAGGEYVWNERYQTMESTVYGHPAEPRDGPDLLPALEMLKGGNFGLTFEEDGKGLRARAELELQDPGGE